jgi:hypothetical protein
MVYRFVGFSFDEAGLVVLIIGFSLALGFFLKSFLHWMGKKVQKTELDLDIEALKQEHQLEPPQKVSATPVEKMDTTIVPEKKRLENTSTKEPVRLEVYGKKESKSRAKKKSKKRK